MIDTHVSFLARQEEERDIEFMNEVKSLNACEKCNNEYVTSKRYCKVMLNEAHYWAISDGLMCP